MTPLVWQRRDTIGLAVSLALLAGVIVLRQFGL